MLCINLYTADSSWWTPPYKSVHSFKSPIKISLKKRAFLADSAKIAVVKIIFHVYKKLYFMCIVFFGPLSLKSPTKRPKEIMNLWKAWVVYSIFSFP